MSTSGDGQAVCPICDGMGYITKDVPVGHPDFGKAFPCVCQRDILAKRRSERLAALSNLSAVADKTFDAFRVEISGISPEHRSTLLAALDIASTYAKKPTGWLVFRGTYGSGKTHLAAAIANYRLQQGELVMFVTAPDLLDHLRSTYAPASELEYDDLFDQVRSARLLVLDDLGAESSTAWAQEKLYQLINHRYLHRLPTVYTTNCDLGELDPRIRSRLADWQISRLVQMDVPDFRRTDTAGEHNLLANFNLYGEMVFETFEMRPNLPPKDRENLERVFEVAFAYAKQPDGWLVFTGHHGSGKTHLAAAIANFRRTVYGETVFFVTAPDLLDYLRAAFNSGAIVTLDKRFRELRHVPLLVIDQLDLTNASPWALEKIRQIADFRYLSRAPTVFTTAQALEDIDPMLRSRLLDSRVCRVLAIIAPDYRGGEGPPFLKKRTPPKKDKKPGVYD